MERTWRNFSTKRDFSNTLFQRNPVKNQFREMSTERTMNNIQNEGMNKWILLLGLGIGLALFDSIEGEEKHKGKVNYEAITKEIENLLEDPNKEDGWGPVLIRLAWHASGTYSVFDHTGGSNGSTMRFCPESRHAANNGLKIARDALEPIKQRHPEISYADLWVLASIVAIKNMGGPDIHFSPGRVDAPNGSVSPPDGRLPDAARNADHVRAIFYRMGFSDREIVALLGAHAVGRCHEANSGFVGAWTHSPSVFSNDFFVQLLNVKWEKTTLPSGNVQFFDPRHEIMMLPTDLELRDDADFHHWAVAYANDEDLFFSDFAVAFEKLVNFNLPTQKK